jgi:hypothetical protein
VPSNQVFCTTGNSPFFCIIHSTFQSRNCTRDNTLEYIYIGVASPQRIIQRPTLTLRALSIAQLTANSVAVWLGALAIILQSINYAQCYPCPSSILLEMSNSSRSFLTSASSSKSICDSKITFFASNGQLVSISDVLLVTS